jgi:hypothetical protein
LGQGADPSRYLGLSLLSLAGQDEHPCDVNSSTTTVFSSTYGRNVERQPTL